MPVAWRLASGGTRNGQSSEHDHVPLPTIATPTGEDMAKCTTIVNIIV